MTLLKISVPDHQFPRIGDIVKINNVDKCYKIFSYAENLPIKEGDIWIQYVYARSCDPSYLDGPDRILPYKATIEGP